uniref:Rho guanine nucleotide exchange factor (GEF) 11 n=1 Tax=Scophthalmus maximus TaxID=52904 RepID=A0A8D2ZQJ4_SCOMX
QASLSRPLKPRLSSLTIGDSERKSSATQQREPTPDLPTEITGPGLIQRCVVVQKDQLGFGFTVCGERVKLVQNVRPESCSVVTAVKKKTQIKFALYVCILFYLPSAGTYVALTLQGPPPSAASLPLEPLPTDLTPNQRTSLAGEAPPPPPPPLPSGLSSNSSQRITGPKPLQASETCQLQRILRKMLEQEEAELQELMEEHSRNPSPSLEERIESAKRRAHQVRVKIQGDVVRTRFTAPKTSPCVSPYVFFTGARDVELNSTKSKTLQIQMDGPFQDIELLKSRPAHMTVFMRYVFTQLLDPNPLLFYLSVEAYLGSSTKDARALAPQICSHFLDPDAVRTDMTHRLHAQEDIRGPLSELQQQVLPDIQDQIQDYRNKQMMGLGSLFGEGDLQHLDGDPVKERQVVDRQVTALWEIFSPLASAVLLYLRHSGIKLRDSKVFPGLSTEKEKWLAFLKTKKLSGTRKEKDGEDKKRNPILKYIGKPRTTSQSSKYTHTHTHTYSCIKVGKETKNRHPAALFINECFSLSLSPTVSVRLARSESLKAQGEGRRRGAAASGTESVPRSRSDVDMEDCGEEREGPGLRPLQHSASSSASSSSARSVDSTLALLPDAAALEDDVSDGQNWQDTVSPQLLATLSPREVDRQAVIYELFTTEASHLRTLRVLDQVFFQKMRSVLNSDELACIFPNLPQVYELHASLCEAMKRRRETPIVQDIGDVMLARFEGAAGDEFQEQASQLCSQQSQAVELIKNKKRKDPRFAHIIQECEASPHCRRLQLKDLMVSEMQRLTKYPLLLDNIIKHTEAGSSDLPSLQRAQACCRGILQVVNEVVGETEQRQRLSQYQRRLDAAPQFKSLDLTTKRMIHEGPLTWKVSKDKQIGQYLCVCVCVEYVPSLCCLVTLCSRALSFPPPSEIQALLLSDCLVLLQRGPDDRLQLRYPSRWLGGGGGGSGDSKTSFSPVVKLDSLLVRSVATGTSTVRYSERWSFVLVPQFPNRHVVVICCGWSHTAGVEVHRGSRRPPVKSHYPTPLFTQSLFMLNVSQ